MDQQIEIRHLYVSSGHDFFGRHGKSREEHEIQDCDTIDLVAGKGVVGDRFFNYKENYKGQVTFFQAEVVAEVQEKFNLPSLTASAFRRNVITYGLDLNSLIGKQFRIGDLEFEGTEEARPCYWMNEACAPQVEDFLRGKGGLRCRILSNGTLRKGKCFVEAR